MSSLSGIDFPWKGPNVRDWGPTNQLPM